MDVFNQMLDPSNFSKVCERKLTKRSEYVCYRRLLKIAVIKRFKRPVNDDFSVEEKCSFEERALCLHSHTLSSSA